MKRWICCALLGLVVGSVGVLAQGPAPRDERRPPPPEQSQRLLPPPLPQHQLALEQRLPPPTPRCPLGRHARPVLALLVLVTAVVHILLAVWVYQDLRRRNTGSGIWIVITLLAGLCGAAVYALVRLGEKPA